MKKEMILGVALLLSGVACAETQEFDFDAVEANKIETITYVFTVSRDESYDKEAWDTLVAFAANAAKRAIASETGDASNEEVLEVTLNAIEKSYEYATKYGIYGNLGIQIGDPELDEDAIKGCDGICGGDDDRPTDR